MKAKPGSKKKSIFHPKTESVSEGPQRLRKKEECDGNCGRYLKKKRNQWVSREVKGEG